MKLPNQDTVPCKTCGDPSAFPGAVQCTNCWEVEHRIDLYLKSEKGHNNIRNKLFKLRYVPADS